MRKLIQEGGEKPTGCSLQQHDKFIRYAMNLRLESLGYSGRQSAIPGNLGTETCIGIAVPDKPGLDLAASVLVPSAE